MFPSGPLGRIVGDTHRRHPPLVKCSRLVRKAGLLATLIVVILLSSGPSSRAVVRKCSRLVRKAGLLATLTAVVRILNFSLTHRNSKQAPYLNCMIRSGL